MPICEYACQQCGEKLDVLVHGDEKPACPHDKSRRLTKLLSVVGGHVANPSSI
jgi:putative FmdB family regulatory protein